MLHYVCRVVANFVSLLFAAEQIVYSELSEIHDSDGSEPKQQSCGSNDESNKKTL